MEYIKIRKVIELLTREEEKTEIKRVKNAIKINFDCWGDYSEVIHKNGESFRINKKLTNLQQQKPIKEQKNILIKNIQKRYNKKLENYINKLEKIETAEQIKNLELSVDWTTGGSYGSQAAATLRAITEHNYYYFEGSKTGGCGYDKRSTATAEVLNHCKPILKLILNKLEKQPIKTITKYLSDYDCREFIGYGIYLKGLCFFCGGVGFSSHINILNNINLKLITEHNTKYNDYYYFEYKNNKKK